MKLIRIKAILFQEYFITIHSIEVILDIFVFPLMSIVLFGFLAKFLSGAVNNQIGQYVIMGMLLWQVVYIVQYSVSLGSLWNIWSRNLSNLYIAPLSVVEYVIAEILSGIVKALTILITSSIISAWVFNFNILSLGFLNLFLFLLNLIFFALSMGIIILGLIFRFGTKIQAFAWGLLPMLQPLTAAFYPVSILPKPLQTIAYLFPPTYIFEAGRLVLDRLPMNFNLIFMAFFINIIYFIFAILFFNYMFDKSKDSGQFARNED